MPRLNELVATLSQANAPDEVTSQHLLAYKQTALRPYIEFFETFVNRLSASMEEIAKLETDAVNVGIHGEMPTLMDVSSK